MQWWGFFGLFVTYLFILAKKFFWQIPKFSKLSVNTLNLFYVMNSFVKLDFLG
jgi:hypothetical protein